MYKTILVLPPAILLPAKELMEGGEMVLIGLYIGVKRYYTGVHRLLLT